MAEALSARRQRSDGAADGADAAAAARPLHDDAGRREHALRRLHAQGRAGAARRARRRAARAPTCRRKRVVVDDRRRPPTPSRSSTRSRPPASRPPRSPTAARPTPSAPTATTCKRLGVAGFAAANIMLLSVSVWSGHAGDMPASLQTLFHWLSALIALPAVAYAGQPFFVSARQALAARRLNMDVPISLGVMLATAMSLYQTVRGSEQVYFDAAVTLLFFLLIGRALDQRMRARAAERRRRTCSACARRSPRSSAPTARIERIADAPTSRPACASSSRPASALPVDGRVVSGASEIDESLITGESRPRARRAGRSASTPAPSTSASPIEAEATAAADNTLLAEIARLMADRRAGARPLRAPRRSRRAALCAGRAHPRGLRPSSAGCSPATAGSRR